MAYEDDLIEKVGRTNVNFPRPKKFSEDFLDDSKHKQHDGSCSSLVMSSNQPDSSHYHHQHMFMKKRQERVLHQINEEDSSQQLYSYLVKTLQDDSLIVYELTYSGGLIRINVFKFESIVKGFPRSISSNYNLYQQSLKFTSSLNERKALVTSEE